MKVKDIIIEKLKELKADGLVNPEAECGCFIDDLCPCDSYCLDCEPGIKKQEGDEIFLYPLRFEKTKNKGVVKRICSLLRKYLHIKYDVYYRDYENQWVIYLNFEGCDVDFNYTYPHRYKVLSIVFGVTYFLIDVIKYILLNCLKLANEKE